MDPDPAPTLPAPQIPEFPEPDYGRRRASKIGRLPKELRDKLNFLLLDGVPHAEIPNRLGEIAKDITENNVNKWATGAFPLWLAEFHRLQETRIKQEVAMDLACPDGGSKIHEATLQLAANSIAEMVRKLDLADFEEMLHTDPAKFIPFLTALATISNAELKCERHRLDLDERKSKADKSQSPQKPPGLSVETRRTMEKDLNLM
jgi:hypothetical protein